MIVKVVPRDPFMRESAIHFAVGQVEVTSGTHWFDAPPEDRDYHAALGIEGDCTVYVRGVEKEPTSAMTVEFGQASARNQGWLMRYAWWRAEDDTIEVVVTSGDIYLMSEQGHTIDKVR